VSDDPEQPPLAGKAEPADPPAPEPRKRPDPALWVLGIGAVMFGSSCVTCQRWWGAADASLTPLDRIMAWMWTAGLVLMLLGVAWALLDRR
jgi:hypothetical protein